MKTTRYIPLVAIAAISLLFSSTGFAQKPVDVDIKKLEIIEQSSPRYSVGLVKDKRISREKKWLEFEVEFEAKKAPRAGDTSPFVDDLLFKYFIAFKGIDPVTRKNVMGVGQLTHINVESGEVTHSAMYVSPSALTRIRGRSGQTSRTEVEGFAVQVFYQGQLVAEDSDFRKSSRWWATGVLPPKDGIALPKSETPFAPLWYDYFAEVQKSR